MKLYTCVITLFCTLPSAVAQLSASSSTSAPTSQPTGNTIVVRVGEGGTPTFNPASITTRVGDIIEFWFVSGNHSVAQTSFATPCSLAADSGFDSGFFPVEAGAATLPAWRIGVFQTEPIWITCGRPGHCSQGMVLAINPTAEKSFDAFLAAAKGNSASALVSPVQTLVVGLGLAFWFIA